MTGFPPLQRMQFVFRILKEALQYETFTSIYNRANVIQHTTFVYPQTNNIQHTTYVYQNIQHTSFSQMKTGAQDISRCNKTKYFKHYPKSVSAVFVGMGPSS